MRTLPDYQDMQLAMANECEQYRAYVTNYPAREAKGPCNLPFSDPEIKNMQARMGGVGNVTDDPSSDAEATKKFGGKLYQSVFASDVQRCWQISLARTQVKGEYLRVRLRLNDAP